LDKERDRGFSGNLKGMVRPSVNLPNLDADSRHLLTESGLPRSAAPCLSFDDTAQLPRIWEVFASGQWDNQQKARLFQHRVLGSDGAGNPICVDETTGEVWLLDHEDWFRTRQFFNTTVAQLAECLLIYRGVSGVDVLGQAIQRVDAPALSDGSFWWHEVAALREDSG
jgi:hypothetical protein